MACEQPRSDDVSELLKATGIGISGRTLSHAGAKVEFKIGNFRLSPTFGCVCACLLGREVPSSHPPWHVTPQRDVTTEVLVVNVDPLLVYQLNDRLADTALSEAGLLRQELVRRPRGAA